MQNLPEPLHVCCSGCAAQRQRPWTGPGAGMDFGLSAETIDTDLRRDYIPQKWKRFHFDCAVLSRKSVETDLEKRARELG